MYIHLLTDEEQKKVIRALRGQWQFERRTHGSLYDRGSADSYYRRSPEPHYGGVGGHSGPRVTVHSPEECQEYMAGYMDNEHNGDHKDYT